MLRIGWEGEDIWFEMSKLSILREFSNAFYCIKCIWSYGYTACLKAYLPSFIPSIFMGCLLSMTSTALSKTKKLFSQYRKVILVC